MSHYTVRRLLETDTNISTKIIALMSDDEALDELRVTLELDKRP